MRSVHNSIRLAIVAIGALVLFAVLTGGVAAADTSEEIELDTDEDLDSDATETASTGDFNGIERRNPSQNLGAGGSGPADATHSISPNMLIDGELTLSEGVTFEITNENTGSSITLTPTADEDVTVSDRVRLSIFDRSGELDAEPQLSETGSDIEVPVTIDGDSDIFTEETIGNYSISVLDEGETVASGEPREMLIGYTPSPVAKADGERIVVTTEAAGIDPDRKLEFSLFGDADAETLQTEGEYNADLDRYVFQYEHEAFEVYNQEGWGFAVDSEGSVTDDGTVFIGSGIFNLEITEVDEINLDGPDDGDDAPDDDAPEDDDDDTPDTDLPEGDAAVSLTPADRTAVSGDSVTYEIVLTGLDNGVSSYDITVGVSDTELLSVTDAAVNREAGFGSEEIAADGSSVQLERALGDNTYEPTDEIVLGELTVETAADANGTAQLDFEDTTINDLDSEAYDSQFDGATLEIVGELPAPDLTGNGQPATDTTGDGKLNDLDGTGEFGINDVQLLFENRDSKPIQNNPELFDFSDSGNVGIGDVQALFESL